MPCRPWIGRHDAIRTGRGRDSRAFDCTQLREWRLYSSPEQSRGDPIRTRDRRCSLPWGRRDSQRRSWRSARATLDPNGDDRHRRWLMGDDVTTPTEGAHEPPQMTVWMTLRQMVVRFRRVADAAPMTRGVHVEVQPVPLLTRVGRTGPLLSAPRLRIGHALFLL